MKSAQEHQNCADALMESFKNEGYIPSDVMYVACLLFAMALHGSKNRLQDAETIDDAMWLISSRVAMLDVVEEASVKH